MSEFTTTPKLGLYKPNYDQDAEHWGDHLNANADTLDLTISGLSTDIGGPFLPIAGGNMGGPLNYYATGATALRSAQDRAADVANVLDFGADPAGAGDSTAAFQAALATGKAVHAPAGTYRITKQLVVGAGHTLYGDSRASTTLSIGADFDPAATGVLSLVGRELSSPVVRDLQISFAQPLNQTSRANFKTLANGGNLTTGIMYPPAIVITTANRFRILNVSVGGAWDGIVNLSGNSIGGYIIDNVEMGALDCGLWLDNQFDFGHVKSYHFWDFGFGNGTTFSQVYMDGHTYAAKFGMNGTCQALMVDDFSTFEAAILIENTNSWVHFVNLGLDGNGAALIVNNCVWCQVVNAYTSAGPNAKPQFSLAGAGTLLVSTHFGGGWFSLTGTGSMHLDNIHPSAQQNTIPIIQQSGGYLYVKDSVLQAPGGFGAWTAVPLIQCTGGITVLVDNVLSGMPAGTTQPGISIATDNAANVVQGNLLNGWAWTPPGTLGFYGINSDFISPRSFQVGGVTAYQNGNATGFAMRANAGQQRAITSYTGTHLRWAVIAGNATAEGGGNAGSDFLIARYDDSGNNIDVPLTITRSTGLVTTFNLETVNFALNATPKPRQTVTGAKGGNAALASLLTALAAFGLITDSTTA